MSLATLKIRRARRTDYVAVMRLLSASGLPVPPPDRAILRRFRHIVNDLGADLYLAFVEEALVGLVYLTYARQLVPPSTARLEMLVADPAIPEVSSLMLDWARQRAKRRECKLRRADLGEVAVP